MKKSYQGLLLLALSLGFLCLGWRCGKSNFYEPPVREGESPYVRTEMVDLNRQFRIVTYFPAYLKEGVQDWSVHVFQNISGEKLDIRMLYLGMAMEDKRDQSSDSGPLAPFTPTRLVLAPGEYRVWRMSWVLNSGLSTGVNNQLVGEQQHFQVGGGDFKQLRFACDYWTPAVTNDNAIKMASPPILCLIDEKAAYFFNDVAFPKK